MMSLLDKGIEIIDLESEEGEVVITAKRLCKQHLESCLQQHL